MNNQGTLAVTNETLDGSGSISSSGTVDIAAGKSLAGNSFTQTTGTTTLGNSSSGLTVGSGPVNIQGGTLAGLGTVSGGLLNAGEVAPGSSPASLPSPARTPRP